MQERDTHGRAWRRQGHWGGGCEALQVMRRGSRGGGEGSEDTPDLAELVVEMGSLTVFLKSTLDAIVRGQVCLSSCF